MTIYQILATLGKPVAYGHHSKPTDPPYFTLMGAGQDQFQADNTYYTKKDHWQIEFYFEDKDPELEETIEALLLQYGLKYDKSEDIYLDDEDIFVIYYDI